MKYLIECGRSLVVMGFVCLVLSGCVIPARPMHEIAPLVNATFADRSAQLGPGDRLELLLAKQPDYTHTVQVGLDGKASFVLVGEFQCAGLTVGELQERLQSAYDRRTVLKDPKVTLTIDALAAPVVFVIGEVVTPGALELGEVGLTLVEAIAKAGGPLKRTANVENTILARWVQKDAQRKVWVMDTSTEFWPKSERIRLQSMDIVIVTTTPIHRLNIMVEQYIRNLIPVPMPTIPL